MSAPSFALTAARAVLETATARRIGVGFGTLERMQVTMDECIAQEIVMALEAEEGGDARAAAEHRGEAESLRRVLHSWTMRHQATAQVPA